MHQDIFKYNRKSYIEIGEIFFWTATINNWQHLLKHDTFKEVIIGSLEYLSNKDKIDVYAFVIMPNHIHLIWKTKELNGKETAQGSFLKFTAHEFKKLVKQEGKLGIYKVDAENKKRVLATGFFSCTLVHTKSSLSKIDIYP